jgi:hypothetical protein
MIVSYHIDISFLQLGGKVLYLIHNGPLSTYQICHNKFEHLPQIDFRIIVASVLNWEREGQV